MKSIKYLLFAFALVLTMALVGCSGDSSDQKTPEVGSAPPSGVGLASDGAAGGGGPAGGDNKPKTGDN